MMLKRILLLLLFSTAASARAQGSLDITIFVVDTRQKPMASVRVELRESVLGEKVSAISDGNGAAHFVLDRGVDWKLYVNQYFYEQENIEVPLDGSARRALKVTYNPALFERWKQQVAERASLKLEEIEQTWKRDESPKEGFSLLRVEVKNSKGIIQPGRKVSIVALKEKRIYTCSSDARGVARFMLPINTKYDVDVEERINADYVDLDSREGLVITVECAYDAIDFKEIKRNDTITQALRFPISPSTCRAWYTIRVRGTGGELLTGEPVYLSEIKGIRIYKAITNNKGEATFMLPLGLKYMVHFNFSQDVDVVNLSHSRGRVQGSMQLVYKRNPRLEFPEEFIPKPEEFFEENLDHFLHKQYPEPKKPSKLALFLNWGNKVNARSQEAVLEIGISGMKQGTKQRKPVNMSLVLDRSGSMEGHDRLDALKKSVIKLLEALNPDDVLSIVLYESQMELLVPAGKIGNRRREIINQVNAIEAGGGTNMLKAMVTGYELVQKAFIQGGVNQVILLTDGYDDNEPAKLLEAQQPFNKKGIVTTTIGVGRDYNVALLKQLATYGGGMMMFAGEAKDMDKVFIENMSMLLDPIGSGALLEIEYNKRIVFSRLLGYPTKKTAQGHNEAKVGNLYAGCQKMLLAQFDLNKPDSTIQKEAILVRLSYTDAATGRMERVEEKAYLQWEPASAKLALFIEAEQKKMFCIAILNQSIKLMVEAYARGDNKAAQQALERCKKQVQDLYPDAMVEDVRKLMGNLDVYLKALQRAAQNTKAKTR